MYIFSDDFVNYFTTTDNPFIGPAKWDGPMSKEAADYALAQHLQKQAVNQPDQR